MTSSPATCSKVAKVDLLIFLQWMDGPCCCAHRFRPRFSLVLTKTDQDLYLFHTFVYTAPPSTLCHKCGACSLPIDGMRYHAIDIPEFVLCESCKQNYDGGDMKFHAVESSMTVDHSTTKSIEERSTVYLLTENKEESSNPADHSPTVTHWAHTCDSCTKPIVGVRYHAINIADYDFCYECRAEYKGEDIQFEVIPSSDPPIAIASTCLDTTPLPSDTELESSSTADRALANSTHWNHTCDSCLTKPIVGLCYQAVNLPNYDLCSDCRANYDGEEIWFELTYQPKTCNSCYASPLDGICYHAGNLHDYDLCTTCKGNYQGGSLQFDAMIAQ